uniref:Iota-carrageenase n=1 Tax=Lygus hesperus TaxID=30085 RepID=A0A0A9WLD0_LYGHE
MSGSTQSTVGSANSKAMSVVDVYVPLSTGGFLSHADVMDSVANMNMGDVVCLRSPSEKHEVYSPTTASSVSESHNDNTSHEKGDGEGNTNYARSSLHKFRSERCLSVQEREHGIEPTVEMMLHMASITRLDRRKGEAEVCSVDGKKSKVSLFALRPAGFV